MSDDAEIAYAKLNLALHVRAREADGYHTIETLFAFCAEGDRLRWREEPGLHVTGPFAAAIGTGQEDNLVLRAHRAFAARFGTAMAGGFYLDKRLPVAAGIGGGSADAAAALRLLARRHGVKADDEALRDVAAGLGADVPACLLSQPVRGTGRGDRLEPLSDPLAPLPVLLVNPMVPLSTGAVFGAWDGADRGALPMGDTLAVARAARNDLEAPARRLCPIVGEVLALLDGRPGVTLTRMSGSGATCFAVFEDIAPRDEADHTIAAARPGWWRLATVLR